MNAFLRAEARKARFTRSLWAMPAAGVLVAIIGSVLVVTVGEEADFATRLSQLGPLRFGPTNFGLLLLVLGIRVFADETQHRTLSATFVRTPDRVRVIVAKVWIAGVMAVLFCIAADAFTIPITVIGVTAQGWDMTYDIGPTAAMLARVMAAMVLLTSLGVAVGAAFRNRTVAMVATIGWFALGEDLVGAVLHAPRYLPGAAVQGLVSNTATPDHLAASASAALLVAYVVGVGAAARVALGRDLT
jgi:ABC-2 type transport system permease protein